MLNICVSYLGISLLNIQITQNLRDRKVPKMEKMKKSNFFSELKLNIKWGMIFVLATFVFMAKSGFSQTPELFEEKVLINNMAAPWAFTFINNNEVLFTEKQGKIYRYTISTGTMNEISGVPAVSQNGQGGLLDIALHPGFSTNNFVYLTYAVVASGGQTTALGRGKLVGNQLQNFTELFRALPIRNSGTHFGSRIVFDRNNLLYMSVGDRGAQENAQNKNNHLGKGGIEISKVWPCTREQVKYMLTNMAPEVETN